jgi:2-polyprenyl-6-methoxyphenol hydroxylase-like FAD-dependent oxidoreductase
MADITPTVIIIGSGPGGLVLAHCLNKMGIKYEIFERESEPRKQGWAVALIE